MKGLVEPGTGINCKVCVYGSTCNTGRGHAYHVKSCVQYTEGKPKTNADRIRSMTDEELALWLAKFTDCSECPISAYPHCTTSDEACACGWHEWLKDEVSE